MKKISLSSAVLKNIAYLTMLIDHFFAVVYTQIWNGLSLPDAQANLAQGVYAAGRAVGRVSFVLFCYLAVESFMHTRSRRNYLLRLGGFALVSEIPFDLAFSRKMIDPDSQNVFFTLFLGILVLTIWEFAKKSCAMLDARQRSRDFGWYLCRGVFEMVRFGGVAAGCMAAYVWKTDYQYMGVLLIVTFYLLHQKGVLLQIAAVGCVLFFGMWSVNCLRYADSYSIAYLCRFSMRELYGLAAFVPIGLYNGKKGKQLPKAVCYGFYPVHLLILSGVARLIAGG